MTCEACGFVNPADHRFCGGCGARLEAREERLVRERRLVSVLFVDLVGFTSFSERTDPEDVRAMLDGYFGLARAAIARHGGVVDKLIGDGVMAVWGATTVREDDAVQAVMAGLEILEGVRGLGGQVAARAGVNTGEAAVDMTGRDAGMVIGDLVNTAARLESAATPGTVLVGAGTYRAAAGALRFEPAGERVLKGKSSPVPTWTALGPRDPREHEALRAPFVGRDDELDELVRLAEAARTRARLVSVVGGAGFGKTRLADELERRLGDEALVLRGRSPGTARQAPLWPLAEVARRLVGAAELDDDTSLRQAVRTRLAELVDDPIERDEIGAAVLQLLAADGAGAPQAELMARWRLLLTRLAERRPLVLVLDDLHYADEATLAFVDHVLDWSSTSPILVVTLARPELAVARPAWGAARSTDHRLALGSLREVDIRGLLASLVDGLPDEATAAIVRRSEGVPLYVVEIVRALAHEGRLVPHGDRLRVDGDIGSVRVPETLTGLVAARLDALHPGDRALVLDASVIGDRFTQEAIAAVSALPPDELGMRLRRLVVSEVLERVHDPHSPERGQYGFVQGLLREVAYQTLARPDRGRRHVTVARHVEQLGSPELAGIVAFHDLAAHQAMATTSERAALALRAVRSTRRAVERSLSLAAFADVAALVDRVLDLAEAPDDVAALREARGRARLELGQYAEALTDLEAAGSFHAGDEETVASLVALQAEALIRGAQFDAASSLVERALAGPAATTTAAGRLRVLLARTLDFRSQSARGYEVAAAVATEAAARGDRALLADALVAKGTCCRRIGRIDEGVAAMAEGIELATAAGDDSVRFRGLINRAWLLVEHDPARALVATEEGLAVARRLGVASMERLLSTFLVDLGSQLGTWRAIDDLLAATELDRWEGADALTLLAAAVGLAAARGDDTEPWLQRLDRVDADAEVKHLYLAETAWDVAMAAGRYDDAMRAGWSLAESASDFYPASWLFAARGSLWAGRPAAARQALERMPDAGRTARTVRPQVAAAEAVVAAALREEGDHLGALLAAHSAILDLGLGWRAAVAALDAGLVFAGHPAVRPLLVQARDLFVELGARPYAARAEELLAPR